MSKILFASDHAGFALKNQLIDFAESLGFEVEDKGDFAPDLADDYPDFVVPVAREISADQTLRGIVVGGSGQGEAIVANRFKDVRAVVWYGGSLEIIRLSREHNNANVLSLGSRFVNEDEAKEAVKLWLETQFSGDERHVRRIAKIDSLS